MSKFVVVALLDDKTTVPLGSFASLNLPVIGSALILNDMAGKPVRALVTGIDQHAYVQTLSIDPEAMYYPMVRVSVDSANTLFCKELIQRITAG